MTSLPGVPQRRWGLRRPFNGVQPRSDSEALPCTSLGLLRYPILFSLPGLNRLHCTHLRLAPAHLHHPGLPAPCLRGCLPSPLLLCETCCTSSIFCLIRPHGCSWFLIRSSTTPVLAILFAYALLLSTVLSPTTEFRRPHLPSRLLLSPSAIKVLEPQAPDCPASRIAPTQELLSIDAARGL